MIWSKGQIRYYTDDRDNVYGASTPSTQTGTWPFDRASQFNMMNLAISGAWPGDWDSSTPFPSAMRIQFVRIQFK
jgi:beta-glucanase (GH16 family)